MPIHKRCVCPCLLLTATGTCRPSSSVLAARPAPLTRCPTPLMSTLTETSDNSIMQARLFGNLFVCLFTRVCFLVLPVGEGRGGSAPAVTSPSTPTPLLSPTRTENATALFLSPPAHFHCSSVWTTATSVVFCLRRERAHSTLPGPPLSSGYCVPLFFLLFLHSPFLPALLALFPPCVCGGGRSVSGGRPTAGPSFVLPLFLRRSGSGISSAALWPSCHRTYSSAAEKSTTYIGTRYPGPSAPPIYAAGAYLPITA